jgi:hypothetical protein
MHENRDCPRKPVRKAASLIFDLPRDIDELLVAHQGYKGKIGAYALNTLVHRLAVLSKAHRNVHVDNPRKG